MLKKNKVFNNFSIRYLSSCLQDKVKSQTINPSILFFLLEDNCNFQCLYCSSPNKIEDLKELTYAKKIKLISDAKQVGVKTIVLSGHGEPLLNKHFYKVYCSAINKKLNCVIITNGSKLTKGMAKRFADDNTEILFKLESLQASTHRRLCNHLNKNTWKTIKKEKKTYRVPLPLYWLLKEFKDKEKKIQIESVITKINYEDIINLGKFCKDLGLRFNPKELRIAGNALLNYDKLFVSKKRLDALYTRLKRMYSQGFIDQLKNSRCLQRDNIVINKYGQGIVCQSVCRVVGDLEKNSILELYRRSLSISKIFPCNITHYKKDIGAKNECGRQDMK